MEGMTPEQRLKRAERILVTMIKSGRRTRSEWRYKINSLIDAQIRHEEVWRQKIDNLTDAQIRHEEVWRQKIDNLTDAQSRHEAIWHVESEAIDRQLKAVAVAQAKNERSIADLTRSQKLTDKALRTFIDSLRKGRNGKSSD
jgi:hypothetical protein